MSSQWFALEELGEKRLEVVQSGIFSKAAEIYLDGEEVGTLPNSTAMRQGRTFNLPDGSKLRVRFPEAVAGRRGVEIRYQGRPVPGSMGHPSWRYTEACQLIYLLAGVNIFFAVLLYVLRPDQMSETLRPIKLSAAMGVTFLVLGVFAQLRVAAVYYLVLGLVVADMLVVLGSAVLEAQRLGPFPLILRGSNLLLTGYILYSLCQGARALHEMKRLERRARTDFDDE